MSTGHLINALSGSRAERSNPGGTTKWNQKPQCKLGFFCKQTWAGSPACPPQAGAPASGGLVLRSKTKGWVGPLKAQSPHSLRSVGLFFV